MKKVWVVSSGSYSDYRVHAAFATEEQAEAAAEAADKADGSNYTRDYFVEELPWYPKGENPEPITVHRMSAVLWDNGTYDTPAYSLDDAKMEFQHYQFVPPPRRAHIRQVRAPIYKEKGAWLEVSARTETMVRKAMNDRLMEHKALGSRRVPEINP